MVRRAIAIVALLALARPVFASDAQPAPTSVTTGAETGVLLKADADAPTTFAKVIWEYQGTRIVGYWFTDKQVEKIDLRLTNLEADKTYLEQKAAKECFDRQVADTQSILLGHPAFLVGSAIGVVVGAVVGVLAYKKLSK